MPHPANSVISQLSNAEIKFQQKLQRILVYIHKHFGSFAQLNSTSKITKSWPTLFTSHASATSTTKIQTKNDEETVVSQVISLLNLHEGDTYVDAKALAKIAELLCQVSCSYPATFFKPGITKTLYAMSKESAFVGKFGSYASLPHEPDPCLEKTRYTISHKTAVELLSLWGNLCESPWQLEFSTNPTTKMISHAYPKDLFGPDSKWSIKAQETLYYVMPLIVKGLGDLRREVTVNNVACAEIKKIIKAELNDPKISDDEIESIANERIIQSIYDLVNASATYSPEQKEEAIRYVLNYAAQNYYTFFHEIIQYLHKNGHIPTNSYTSTKTLYSNYTMKDGKLALEFKIQYSNLMYQHGNNFTFYCGQLAKNGTDIDLLQETEPRAKYDYPVLEMEACITFDQPPGAETLIPCLSQLKFTSDCGELKGYAWYGGQATSLEVKPKESPALPLDCADKKPSPLLAPVFR